MCASIWHVDSFLSLPGPPRRYFPAGSSHQQPPTTPASIMNRSTKSTLLSNVSNMKFPTPLTSRPSSRAAAKRNEYWARVHIKWNIRGYFDPKHCGACSTSTHIAGVNACTYPQQCFFSSQHIGQVTPKIIHVHHLKKCFLDQSISKTLYLILKTAALVFKFSNTVSMLVQHGDRTPRAAESQ